MSERIMLDPTSEWAPSQRGILPRLPGLEGRTVALLDISKPRGDVFLDRIGELLSAAGVRVERYVKPTFTRPAPPDIRQQISTRCDAVIEALAD